MQQVDTPRAIYDRPVNTFVAGFIGSPAMNLRQVAVSGGVAQLGGARLALPASVQSTGRSELIVGLRPESIDIVTPDAAGAMPMHVTLLEQLGADSYVYGLLPGDDVEKDKPFIVRVDGRYEPKRGETISVAARGAAEHVFDPESGDRLD